MLLSSLDDRSLRAMTMTAPQEQGPRTLSIPLSRMRCGHEFGPLSRPEQVWQPPAGTRRCGRERSVFMLPLRTIRRAGVNPDDLAGEGNVRVMLSVKDHAERAPAGHTHGLVDEPHDAFGLPDTPVEAAVQDLILENRGSRAVTRPRLCHASIFVGLSPSRRFGRS